MLRLGALVPHVLPYGGVRRFVEMGNVFTRRGHSFTLYHPAGTPPPWIAYHGRTAPLDHASWEPLDVVLCGDSGLLDRLAAAPARLRILNAIGRRYAGEYRRHLAPGIVAVGNSIEWKEYLSGVAGHTAPGGVNLETFRPVPVARNGVFRVLCYGRLDKKVKGTRDVLDAFRRWNPSDARLTIYSAEASPLPWSVRLSRVRERIEQVAGVAQDKLAELYSSADLFVSGERSAGWSNTCAEAMACGVPVVCTPMGTQDFAEHGKTAWIVPSGDVEAIEAALRILRGDPARRAALAQAGRERIQAFSWEKLCDRFEEIIRQELTDAPPSETKKPGP